MSAKSARFTDSAGNAALVPLNFLVDLPRRQLALMTQSASAIFRASEAVREMQQQAAHRALTQHEEANERLRAPCDFNELMTIQAELLRFNMQEATQYWQQLGAAAMKVQADLMSNAGQVAMETGKEPTLEALQRAFAATLDGSTSAAASH